MFDGVRELHREREDLGPAAVALQRELAERVERVADDLRPVDEVVQLRGQFRLVVERLLDGGGDGILLLPVKRAVIQLERLANLAAGVGRDRGERRPGGFGEKRELFARQLVELGGPGRRLERGGVDRHRRRVGGTE